MRFSKIVPFAVDVTQSESLVETQALGGKKRTTGAPRGMRKISQDQGFEAPYGNQCYNQRALSKLQGPLGEMKKAGHRTETKYRNLDHHTLDRRDEEGGSPH